MPKQAQIQIKDLSKSYGTVEVINDFNAELDQGAFTVILGPSGCGKSTLLNMLAGLEQVNDGTIHFGDREVQNLPAKDRGCAMVFQNYALYPHMNVSKNIGYALKVAGVPKDEIRLRVLDAAKMVDLQDVLERRPSELSGGQRQRVAIARAVVREPEVLLFDEPLSNLDAKLRHEMRKELKNLHERIGATSVFVTHDQVEAMTLADKILILNKGNIEQFDTPHNIYHKPASTFVAGFIGSPPMNLMNGFAEDGQFILSDGTALALNARSGPLVLGIRPEHISISDQGIPARITYREDLGSHAVLNIQLEQGLELVLATPHSVGAPEKDDILLNIDPKHFHFFDPESKRRLSNDAT
jgi:sn-glycerol 3-phosphate transport system ATP-binding protein